MHFIKLIASIILIISTKSSSNFYIRFEPNENFAGDYKEAIWRNINSLGYVGVYPNGEYFDSLAIFNQFVSDEWPINQNIEIVSNKRIAEGIPADITHIYIFSGKKELIPIKNDYIYKFKYDVERFKLAFTGLESVDNNDQCSIS